MVSDTQRRHKIHEVGAACLLMEIFEVEGDFEERGNYLVRSILNLIEFQSKRCLIKELGSTGGGVDGG